MAKVYQLFLLPVTSLFLMAMPARAQYHGGANDGYGLAAVLNTNPLVNIYTGGANDGFQSLAVPNALNPLTGIYTGGSDDGFGMAAAPAQNSLAEIYRGGSNDGFALQASLSALNALTNIYTGGTNDGFATQAQNNANPLPNIYTGESDDGFAWSAKSNLNPLSDIYRGGGNDGFATLAVNLLHSLETPLPLSLLLFTGQWQDNDAVLEWKTGFELDLNRFELERSTDGGFRFETVGTVSPWGGPNTESYYRYPDHGAALLPAAVWLYRLKTIDQNGDSRYSAIVRLTRTPGEPVMILYPNPTSGSFVLELRSVTSLSPYACVLTGMNGAVLQTVPITRPVTTFDIADRPAGQYILTVLKDGTAIAHFKIMLTR